MTDDEQATDEKHETPKKLQSYVSRVSRRRREGGGRVRTDGDPPGGARLDLLHSQVDELGDKNTESDGELVARDERSSNSRRSGFGCT